MDEVEGRMKWMEGFRGGCGLRGEMKGWMWWRDEGVEGRMER